MFRRSELTQTKKLGLAIRLRQGLQLHLTPNHHSQGESGKKEPFPPNSETLSKYSVNTNTEEKDAEAQTPVGTELNNYTGIRYHVCGVLLIL